MSQPRIELIAVFLRLDRFGNEEEILSERIGAVYHSFIVVGPDEHYAGAVEMLKDRARSHAKRTGESVRVAEFIRGDGREEDITP